MSDGVFKPLMSKLDANVKKNAWTGCKKKTERATGWLLNGKTGPDQILTRFIQILIVSN